MSCRGAYGQVNERFGRPVGKCLDKIRRFGGSVRCHDVSRDSLPEATFDLVHTRLVLIHLPERDRVLSRLAAALKPGGWLVCEEFDSLTYSPDPALSPGEEVLKIHESMGRVMEAQGVDRQYGRLLYGRFRYLGLTRIGAEGRMSMVTCESPDSVLLRASYELRREAMLAHGFLTLEEFDRDIARMNDEDFVMPSPLMWTVWGQRP